MNGLILYKGKYGATRQYAYWLGKELALPMVSADNIGGRQIKPYDFLLIGTSVYIGKLQVRNWMKENETYLSGKKIFLFQVAAAPATDIEKRMAYISSGVPTGLMTDCKFFFLDGRMKMDKLRWWDRFLLKMGARLTRDAGARKNMLTDFDKVKKENLDEMLSFIRQYLYDHASLPAGAHPALTA
jgi:menaquinone-dependent protoporphyrinogen IX oxidase